MSNENFSDEINNFQEKLESYVNKMPQVLENFKKHYIRANTFFKDKEYAHNLENSKNQIHDLSITRSDQFYSDCYHDTVYLLCMNSTQSLDMKLFFKLVLFLDI